jgi:uncharacterized OB-fold protein
VEYLRLGDEAHLVAQECDACGERFFDHRIGCAACGASAFHSVAVSTSGVLKTFTVIGVAAPGIPTPFVAAVVDCDGTLVRANVVNVPADPDHIRPGMRLKLCTYSMGEDINGLEAISFAFEPAA